MRVYDEYIESVMNSYEVTTDESGRLSIKYVQQSDNYNGTDINAIMECAEKNMYSFSILKAIYNFIFKRNKVKQQMPCTMMFDLMNYKHA